jgi:aminopeptidase
MVHPLIERYAELLVHYCVQAQEGELIALHVPHGALDLARALNRTVLKAGARPALRIHYPEAVEDFLELASDRVLDSTPMLDLLEVEHAAGWIRVAAPVNSRSMQQSDKARLGRLMKAHAPVQEKRLAGTRWVGTLYPTAAAAQDAGMSTDAFADFVYRAMFLDSDDPVARWGELRTVQASLIERLARAELIELKGPGTDLRLRVTGRTWMNSDGRRNMPSGEVFTGPIESSAEGVITFNIPSSVGGTLVRDVELRFEGGKVVAARAAEGEDMLQAQLNTDAGARMLGEIGIGTNFAITQPILNTLYDEKIGGTVHLALGRSYPESGGVNESAIHWDLITDLRDGGEIRLDGELFAENGRFV